MENKPVFESFDQFVKFVYEAKIFEDNKGYVGSLADILSGGMKLDGSNKSEAVTLVSKFLNKYYADGVTAGPEMGKVLIEQLKTTFDALNNPPNISTKAGKVKVVNIDTLYKYLQAGTVQAEGYPDRDRPAEAGSGKINPGGLGTNGMERLPLAELLALINFHNFMAFAQCVDDLSYAGNNPKDFTNVGYDSKYKNYAKLSATNDGIRFIQMDQKSLSGNTIQLIPYYPKANNNSSISWGWEFPIYAAKTITPGAGNVVDASVYDEVIQPAGNSVAVTDKEYNSSGVNFFDENTVVISDDGKKALNAILSQYNSIDKILVNGGASSKPTSRAGGNEQLAKDRQASGIALLNELKKSGVAQLKPAEIAAGTAKVQAAAPDESDPKNQQVSFIITGKIKSTEVVEKGPVVIETVEEMKADAVRFEEYLICIFVDEEPTAKNINA